MSTPTLFDEPLENGRPQKWVTVSNDMVMARMDWDIMMHRIMMVLISQIDSQQDEAFRPQCVRVRDIRDLAQVSQKSIHKEAAHAASKLVREPIEFWSDDKQDYEGYPIFSFCKYRSREGIIEAKFNDDARLFLLQLSKRFTQYRLKQAIPLSTPYAIRTYEIAKMVERPGQKRIQEIPLDRFRQMFRLENKYARHSDMRRRVINPSVEEVNRKCDVDVGCTDVRDGRTPVALKWKVTSMGPAKEPKPTVRQQETPAISSPPSDDEESPYRTWYEGLDPDVRQNVRQEAEARAESAGYQRNQSRSFEAGVEMKLHAIYRDHRDEQSGK